MASSISSRKRNKGTLMEEEQSCLSAEDTTVCIEKPQRISKNRTSTQSELTKVEGHFLSIPKRMRFLFLARNGWTPKLNRLYHLQLLNKMKEMKEGGRLEKERRKG